MPRIAEVLLDLLVPTCCLGCRIWAPLGPLGLCRSCRSALVATDSKRCKTCARRLPAAPRPGRDVRCGECATRPPAFTELLTLYAYQPPLDGVVKAMKFSRRPYLAQLLADEMWDRWAERFLGVRFVVPVPLPWTRQCLRGYNQAELLARGLAERLGTATAQPLRRRRGSPQSLETNLAGRRRNARRSFDLKVDRRGSALRATFDRVDRILLVDDVVTSGATLQRCAELLRRAGAGSVICAAIAHRPALPRRLRTAGIGRRRNASRRKTVPSE